EDVQTPPTAVDQDLAKTYAKVLAKMVQVKTLSYDEEKDNKEAFIQLKDVMASIFPHVFETMTTKTFKGEGILLHWQGKDKQKPIVLMSHLDVVDVEESAWDYPAFSATIKDGEIIGRGTLDTKSTVFAFYQACEGLIKDGYQPNRDVYLYSSTNEESSGPGASYAVDYLKAQGIEPFLVLDEGGAIVTGALPTVKKPLAMVGIIEKGYANLAFKAKSKGGHSSTPPKNTPIARLSAFVNDVENHFPLKTKMIPEVEHIFKTAAPYMRGLLRYLFVNLWLFKPLIVKLLPKMSPYGRALLSTTIAFTMMEGSTQANVIPSQATMTANLRIHPIQDIDESVAVLRKIAEKYDIEVDVLAHRKASPMTDIKGPAYKYLEKTIKEVFPDVQTSPYVMLGGTDCRFFSQISKGALRFSPIRMHQNELSKMHGHNESIRISTLVEAVRFYQTIIQNHH
ncbi:MAG TPA: M20/M25/M40 family metallo-hydrolase, partial [Candidatus Izemoplasmatales bacterium]|nr:M20/M25/M40 family metallo-hydrolase [Candidatus Izemoplasmatales bacterium]